MTEVSSHGEAGLRGKYAANVRDSGTVQYVRGRSEGPFTVVRPKSAVVVPRLPHTALNQMTISPIQSVMIALLSPHWHINAITRSGSGKVNADAQYTRHRRFFIHFPPRYSSSVLRIHRPLCPRTLQRSRQTRTINSSSTML